MEITITLTTGEQTESLSLSPTDTTLSELANFAGAFFDLNSSKLELLKNSQPLLVHQYTNDTTNLQAAGLVHGDVIFVIPDKSVLDQGRDRRSNNAPPQSNSHNSNNNNSGGLDFSSLLAPSSLSSSAPNNTTYGVAPPSSLLVPREWPNMSLDDAVNANPQPELFIQVLFSSSHPNLIKQLNYHDPLLARKLTQANMTSRDLAVRLWREELTKRSISAAVKVSSNMNTERQMRLKLETNPMDEEANKYFGEKIQQQNIMKQYYEMMEQYPESMGRVLMLYIDTKVNDKPLQAFVDSGAQSTIMSASCVERLGLIHLVDKRFEGTAVGVGTGKIMGRIHIVELEIEGHIFPCSVTVMDDSQGLGDKNMDFLFGLDMLKRHRCKIDLDSNSLLMSIGNDQFLTTKFLHEKDLDEKKGGTKGFNAEAANSELLKMIEEDDSKDSSKK